jgi:hypothetical protein
MSFNLLYGKVLESIDLNAAIKTSFALVVVLVRYLDYMGRTGTADM